MVCVGSGVQAWLGCDAHHVAAGTSPACQVRSGVSPPLPAAAPLPAPQPVSTGEARFINLQFHAASKTPYLAYSDQGINGGAAVVRRWM